jgi:outer membrane receptor protein involved in Fe transport
VAALAAGPTRYHFNLPAAPLSVGVARIGALTHVSIATPDAELLAADGHAVHIDGTAAEAIAALFAGTAARPQRVGQNAWRIAPRRRQPRAPAQAMSVANDIIVTGSKRNSLFSAYPTGVELIDGATLIRFGKTPDTSALTRLDPTLQSTHLGPGRNKLFLRGIADSSFNGSSASLVGIYVNDLRLTYNAPDPDLRLYDVSRVEVLEGAQGTLYGAGSMAGLVRITPHAPDFEKASAEAWAGGSVTAHGAPGSDEGAVINLPFASGRAALRVVAYDSYDGGYIDDIARRIADVNETKTLGGRMTLRIKLDEHWLLDIGGIAQDIRNSDAQYADRTLPPLTRSSTAAQPSSNRFRSGSVVLSGPVGALRINSTTGIVDQSLDQHFQPDAGNGIQLYRQRDAIRLLSEEIRLSRAAGTWLDWVIGLAALNSSAEQIRTLSFDGSDRSLGRAYNNITDLTAFGELTAHLTGTFALTAGGRLAAVRLAGVASGAEEKSDDGTKIPGDSAPHFRGIRQERFAVPSLALAFTPDKSWLFYARYSEGYRPGGQTASGIIERYDADRIDGLEAGLRLTSRGSAQLAAQLFAAITWWHAIQADILDANGLPVTANVGNGKVRSVTGSLDWKPISSLDARIAATLARGRVTGYDGPLNAIVRTSLPNVARDTLAASLDYRHAINDRHSLGGGVSLEHVGPSVLGSGSVLSKIRQGGYWLLAGGADVDIGANTVSINVDNILDSDADSFAFGTPSFRYNGQQLTPLRPRTVRIGLQHRF